MESYRSTMTAARRKYLSAALRKCKWDVNKCSEISGLTRARIYQLIKELGLRQTEKPLAPGHPTNGNGFFRLEACQGNITKI